MEIQGKKVDYIDIVMRVVEGYGVLPIVLAEDDEIFRGEFQSSMDEALLRVQSNLPNIEDLF